MLNGTKYSKIGKIKVSSENQCRFLQRCAAKSCLTSTGDFCGNANIIGRKRKITENRLTHITIPFFGFLQKKTGRTSLILGMLRSSIHIALGNLI